MSGRTPNQKAWWLVMPVVLLVAFNAVIPLMTVVNYSVQETFGDNQFFFEGVTWFEQILHSSRFHDALERQLLFTAIVLAIEVPLGVAIALAMPRSGVWSSVCLVLMAMPLLIPDSNELRSENKVQMPPISIAPTPMKRTWLPRMRPAASAADSPTSCAASSGFWPSMKLL